MKRIVSLIISAVMVSAVLAGCGAQESDLVSKEPFPAVSYTHLTLPTNREV